MSRPVKPLVKYPVFLCTKVDFETREDLDNIVFSDWKSVATVRRHQRNPQFNKFRRDLSR